MILDELQSKQTTRPAMEQLHENHALFNIGYALLLASSALYLISELVTLRSNDDALTYFFVHYVIACVLLIFMASHRVVGIRKSFHRENIDLNIILINLFLISAYALNRELDVFQESVFWLCIVIVTTSATALIFRFYTALPPFAQGLGKAILGVAILLYAYMAIYAAPYYMFGAVGTIFLGVGFHIFVPLIMVVALVSLLIHISRQHGHTYYWAFIGAGLAIAYTIFFVLEWRGRIERYAKISHNSVLLENETLPVWIRLSETIEDDWITKRILKADLTYSTYTPHAWRFLPDQLSWDEQRQHDPMVFIGSYFGKVNLTNEDRIKILHTMSERRHKSEERLWRGDNLITSHIINDIDLYPQLRLAYTENYFDIRNTAANGGWWGNSQEALYTFQLPEGSVVTSLSLWVEGKERKGILTSKGKATEAYNTVVGVEQRDPSVVHWREGNTVVVRVFPCTPEEERKVKVGITTPLQVRDGKLIFRNLAFNGPTASDAQQLLRVRFPGQKSPMTLPSSFTLDNKGYYTIEQSFDEEFELSIPLQEIPENHFTFNGFTYRIQQYNEAFEPVTFDHFYLDLNKAWSTEELNSVRKLVDYKKVTAYADGEFITIDQANWDKIVPILAQRNFSIFPFHQINDVAQALVITKGNPLSIQLADLKESTFADDMGTFFAQKHQPYVFNIEGATSTYIRSLKEFRVLKYATGPLTSLEDILKQKHFPANTESDSKIILHDADIAITRTTATAEAQTNNAPDHLVRLFAYNDIMRRTGHHFFEEGAHQPALVEAAAKAYVVSPVSSLIVLETQEDYDRFGIKDIENSLGNAAKQSTGAVPEPHEWILIILCVLVVIYLKFKH